MNTTPIIDSHQHFWDRTIAQFDHSWQDSPELSKICRSFMPADLQPLLKASDVDHSVFVQTQHNLDENRWALDLLDQHDFVCGVVGWVDLKSPQCESQLLEFIEHPGFVGVRHVTQDEPDDDFIISDEVALGLGVLQKHSVPFDLLFYDRHLKHAETVARRFPDQRFVIDHLSKPPIRRGDIDQWRQEMMRAGKCNNIFCKVSGMVTEADWESWNIEDIRPYFEVVLEAFGTERLMFGSDWPVCELAGSYQQVVRLTRQLISTLSPSEQAAILGGNAVKFYRLTVSTDDAGS